MDPLALISIAQLLAIAPFLCGPPWDDVTAGYCATIAASTAASSIWHQSKESGLAAIPYYTTSYLWFNYDLYMAYYFTVKPYFVFHIGMLNIIIGYLGLSIEKDNKYVVNKGLWYVASITKSIFISYLLAMNYSRA